ncbi:hypothetical protein B0H14DRAFT_2516587 [Mycena olivaceomarginata]|nr:hypothetical protein B0H14DRAFT_2516587 [Mycena olivaceomarginata]
MTHRTIFRFLKYLVGFLARARDRLDSLDEIVAPVQGRDAIAENMRSHTAVISTIRRLPVEILCTIFSMMLVQPHIWSSRKPRGLALVCRRWRNVAVTLSSLWSSFGFHTSPYYDRDGTHRKKS